MPAHFEKWHGLGNDFVVVFDEDPARWRARARAVTDRHRGVGADGVLVVQRDPAAMRVINADGSEPEMCGNGLRCVAAALARQGARVGAVQTGAGALDCEVTPGAAMEWLVTVAAGTPSFEPARAGVAGYEGETWLDAPIGRGVVVSVGNPHWVFFEHSGFDALDAHGRQLEHDPRFAHRTNVELLEQVAPSRWRLRVWERGVGLTQACGTGATAAAAALVRTGREPAGRPIEIMLPGGPLTITIDGAGAATVRGPAAFVYEGVLPD